MIQIKFAISAESGYETASAYAANCRNYIHGFIAGNIANGNVNEYDSKRYTDWAQEQETLLGEMVHFIYLGDFGNASYYAKKEFELNCQYENDLHRE